MELTVGPSFSRRQILSAAGALAAASLAPGLLRNLPVAQLFPASSAPDEMELILRRFTPHVASEFLIRTGTRHTERVILVEATAWEPPPGGQRGLEGESFSLIFAGAGAKAFEDGIFTVSHPSMGAFPLFLVPVGRAVHTQRYQAVVDRRTLPR